MVTVRKTESGGANLVTSFACLNPYLSGYFPGPNQGRIQSEGNKVGGSEDIVFDFLFVSIHSYIIVADAFHSI